MWFSWYWSGDSYKWSNTFKKGQRTCRADWFLRKRKMRKRKYTEEGRFMILFRIMNTCFLDNCSLHNQTKSAFDGLAVFLFFIKICRNILKNSQTMNKIVSCPRSLIFWGYFWEHENRRTPKIGANSENRGRTPKIGANSENRGELRKSGANSEHRGEIEEIRARSSGREGNSKRRNMRRNSREKDILLYLVVCCASVFNKTLKKWKIYGLDLVLWSFEKKCNLRRGKLSWLESMNCPCFVRYPVLFLIFSLNFSLNLLLFDLIFDLIFDQLAKEIFSISLCLRSSGRNRKQNSEKPKTSQTSETKLNLVPRHNQNHKQT